VSGYRFKAMTNSVSRQWSIYIANKDVLCRFLYCLSKLGVCKYDEGSVMSPLAQLFLDKVWRC